MTSSIKFGTSGWRAIVADEFTLARGHVPEKDGIIAGLLVTEMVAARKKSLGKQLKELFAKVGSFYPVRENFRLTPQRKAAFTEELKKDPAKLGERRSARSCAPTGLSWSSKTARGCASSFPAPSRWCAPRPKPETRRIWSPSDPPPRSLYRVSPASQRSIGIRQASGHDFSRPANEVSLLSCHPECTGPQA